MKKAWFPILVLSAVILNGCGSSNSTPSDTGTSTEPYFYSFRTAEFTIDVPDEWEVQESFTSEYPSGLQVAFLNNIKESSFVGNVSVLKESTSTAMTSYDLAQTKLKEHQDNLIGYELVSQESLTLTVGGADSSTTLSTFEGKNSASAPTLQFMQVVLAKGQNAWTVTAAYQATEDVFVIERMDHMLHSFTLKL